MITLHNEQTEVAVDTKRMEDAAQRMLTILGYNDFDLGILLTSAEGMQTYNRDYRGIDKATDVLSFPFYPDLTPGDKIQASDDDAKNVGDIIICPAYAQTTLIDWDQSIEERMDGLLVHGICHLLGYDHETDEQEEQMLAMEAKLLSKIKKS
jgi:probable rRNA maturation factor